MRSFIQILDKCALFIGYAAMIYYLLESSLVSIKYLRREKSPKPNYTKEVDRLLQLDDFEAALAPEDKLETA